VSRVPLLLVLALATAVVLAPVRPAADVLFDYHGGNAVVGKVAVCVYNRTDYSNTGPWGPNYVYKCRGVFTLWQVRKWIYGCRRPNHAVGLGDRALVFYSTVIARGDEVAVDKWALYQMHNVTAFGADWVNAPRPAPPVPREVSLFEWCFT